MTVSVSAGRFTDEDDDGMDLWVAGVDVGFELPSDRATVVAVLVSGAEVGCLAEEDWGSTWTDRVAFVV